MDLKRLSMIYFIGSGLSKIISFGSFFIYTHYLSKQQLGEYDLILNSLSFIVPLISLQVESSLFRFLMEDSSAENRRRVLSGVVTFLLVSGTLFSIIFILSSYYLALKYAFWLYLLAMLQVLNLVLMQYLRGTGSSLVYVRLMIWNSLTSFILSLLAIAVWDYKIEGVLFANCFSLVICVSYAFFSNKEIRHLAVDFNFAFIKQMLRYSLPLLPNSFNWLFITTFNRFIILSFLGVESAGIFATSFKLPALVLMLADIFYISWQEVYLKRNEDEEYNSLVLMNYIKVLFAALLVLTAFSKTFIRLIVGSDFLESWKYTPILLYACLLQALTSFFGVPYLKSGKTRQLFRSTFFGAIITSVLGCLLIRSWGLYGIAMAVLVGFLAVLLIRIVEGTKSSKITFPMATFLKSSIAFIIVSTATYYLEHVYLLIAQFATLSLVFYFYRDLITHQFIKKERVAK